MNITLGDTLEVWFDYDPVLRDRLKMVSGSVYDKKRGCWNVPLEYYSIIHMIEALGDYPEFTFDHKVLNAVEKVTRESKRRLRLSSSTIPTQYLNIFDRMSPYQEVGVEYMGEVRRGYIADSAGVGKTLQALGILKHLEITPALIIVPAFLTLKWRDEIKEWTDFSYQIINSKKDQLEFKDITLISYDNLASGWINRKQKKVRLSSPMGEICGNIGAIVMDELHYCKSKQAQRSRAVHALSRDVSYRIGLTGSPMLNRPEELIYPLEILDRLDDFGGFWDFGKRYCALRKTQFGLDLSGSTNRDELFERLRMNCMIRRSKDQVLTDLPPKRHVSVPVEITNRKEYRYAENQLIEWVKEKAMEDPEFLESIAYLDLDEQEQEKFLKGLDATRKAMAAETLIRVNALKRLTADGKVDAAKRWIEDFLEGDEQLVIFAHHTNIVDQIADHFSVPSIKGGVSHQKRHEITQSFQNGEIRVLPLNIQAGGVGIDLYTSSNVLFLEYPWSPGIYDQASDRVHRRGQEDSVTIWNLIGENTIDFNITRLLEEKRRVIEAVTDNKPATPIFGDFLNSLV